MATPPCVFCGAAEFSQDTGVRVPGDVEKLGLLAPAFRAFVSPLIDTVALARWRGVAVGLELFQQFPAGGEKPLKRLNPRHSDYHRAKATVLMRASVELRSFQASHCMVPLAEQYA